jgi:hypothetical protein
LQQTLRLAAAGEMAGALSHELHQPLTALLAYTRACQQLLAQGESGERLRDVIDRVVAESQRAAEVVSRLRDFFRTGTTRLERIWLRELLSSAASRFAAQAKQQGVELLLQPAPPCALWADRLQLEVVLRNLLANAFEAAAERPEAGVRCAFRHSRTALGVSASRSRTAAQAYRRKWWNICSKRFNHRRPAAWGLACRSAGRSSRRTAAPVGRGGRSRRVQGGSADRGGSRRCHIEVNTVFIVEDDHSVRDALGLLLGLQGLSVALFADAESFLAARRPTGTAACWSTSACREWTV